MPTTTALRSRVLDAIVAYLDIPKSYYEKASARHRSLYEWLTREDSKVAAFQPDVRPQGSFRYGTVVRPLFEGDEYDLDNVCLLPLLSKSVMSQEQLKNLYGEEIKGYAAAHSMLAPVSEHNRCWRLSYADEASFHLDTLPCVPAEESAVALILQQQVERDLARRAVAITDRKHPRYRELCRDWLSSNPRGFAAWFESRAALGRRLTTNEIALRASLEDVPPYEWKTTLQRSIQLLKRHRDVMFRKRSELAPISMIITNLAARAYKGEDDIFAALANIVDQMPGLISPVAPRVPNPTHPAEDYAEKWALNPRLEKAFYEWHTAVSADLGNLQRLIGASELPGFVDDCFQVRFSDDEVRAFAKSSQPALRTPAVAAPVSIPHASKPWSDS